MSREAVSQNVSKLNELNLLTKADFFDKKKPLKDIAEY